MRWLPSLTLTAVFIIVAAANKYIVEKNLIVTPMAFSVAWPIGGLGQLSAGVTGPATVAGFAVDAAIGWALAAVMTIWRLPHRS